MKIIKREKRRKIDSCSMFVYRFDYVYLSCQCTRIYRWSSSQSQTEYLQTSNEFSHNISVCRKTNVDRWKFFFLEIYPFWPERSSCVLFVGQIQRPRVNYHRSNKKSFHLGLIHRIKSNSKSNRLIEWKSFFSAYKKYQQNARQTRHQEWSGYGLATWCNIS